MKRLIQHLLMLGFLSCFITEVEAQCKASYQFNVSNSTVYFYDSSYTTSGYATYKWTFGDGTASSLKNPTHAYNGLGPYTVCLIISDSTCSDTFCQSISLGGSGSSCHAKYSDSVSGNDVYFYDLSTGTTNNTRYTWDFGDNNTSTSQNPSHNYATSGQYYVCLSITDSNCSDNYCSYITVASTGNSCKAKFIDSIGANNVVSFTNYSIGSNGGSVYTSSWDFGDSTFATGNNVSHTYNSAGTYYVCLTISDSNCSDTYCSYIYVGNPNTGCKADFTYVRKASSYVAFINSSSGTATTSYKWTFGDGTSSTLMNPQHQYNSLGNFNVCLIISDSNCSDTFCTTINVNNNFDLYGAVILKNTNIPAYPAMVWAIVYDTTGGGSLTAIDSTYTDSAGSYAFNLTAGDYLFKAALTDTASNSYKNFMPTYYKDQLKWDTANLVAVYTRITGLNINLIQGNNPGGPGFIGGKVSQGANKNGNFGDPMNNVYIMLMNDKDQPVAYTYSDMNGNYSFDNIAYGTYTITNDILGKKSFGLQVTISSQQPKQTNINVEINSVSVVVVNGVSIAQANYALSGVSVYPNPVQDILSIHQPSNDKYKLDIFDMTGKMVFSSTVTENNSSIDIKDLTAGIYMIKLIDKNGNLGVYKIVKN